MSGAVFNNGVQTILDQKGFYPPSSDIICDNVKGPYVGAAQVNSSNGQLITPVWVEQGSINTNYPLYCPPDGEKNVCVPNMGVFKSLSSVENQSESYNQLINNTLPC